MSWLYYSISYLFIMLWLQSNIFMCTDRQKRTHSPDFITQLCASVVSGGNTSENGSVTHTDVRKMKSALQQLWKIMGRDGIRRLLHNRVNAQAWRWHEGSVWGTVDTKSFLQLLFEYGSPTEHKDVIIMRWKAHLGDKARGGPSWDLRPFRVELARWVLFQVLQLPPWLSEWVRAGMVACLCMWHCDKWAACPGCSHALPWRQLGSAPAAPPAKPECRRSSDRKHKHTLTMKTKDIPD